MRSLFCVLFLSPYLLLNCEGAHVANIYRSYANKMFGGNQGCITTTDVSSANSAEGKTFLFVVSQSLIMIDLKLLDSSAAFLLIADSAQTEYSTTFQCPSVRPFSHFSHV